MYSERADSAAALLADINLRCEALKAEREQVRRRMEDNTAAISQVKGRIEELEGSAAALRAESEAKAQGQSALQARVSELNGKWQNRMPSWQVWTVNVPPLPRTCPNWNS